MGRNQWWDKLNQVVGQLQGQEAAERTALATCAAFFRRAGQTQFAKEAYVKLQDYQVSSLCSQTLIWKTGMQQSNCIGVHQQALGLLTSVAYLLPALQEFAMSKVTSPI